MIVIGLNKWHAFYLYIHSEVIKKGLEGTFLKQKYLQKLFMIKSYFKIALRNLQRSKIFSFINIAGLSLGLACAMLIILYVKDEVSYDRFQANLPNIYRVVTENVRPGEMGEVKDGNTGYFQGPRFTENVPGIRSFVRIQSGQEDRNFSPEFPSDLSNSVIVNESFVKQAGWKNALGQTVDFWFRNEKYNVIGVVKDHHYLPLDQKIKPQLFTMKAGNQYGMAMIKIKDGSATESLRYIQATFKKLFPLSPYSYQFKDLENSNSYEAEARWKQIILFSAILTIFISCIGLFGLSVLSVEKRKKEIGVRKVLGASVRNVVTTHSTDFMKLVCLAMVIAIPLAYMASVKWLEHYPYRITLGWGIFAAAGMIVLFIAVATISFQAIKAAVANPVESLRTE